MLLFNITFMLTSTYIGHMQMYYILVDLNIYRSYSNTNATIQHYILVDLKIYRLYTNVAIQYYIWLTSRYIGYIQMSPYNITFELIPVHHWDMLDYHDCSLHRLYFHMSSLVHTGYKVGTSYPFQYRWCFCE